MTDLQFFLLALGALIIVAVVLFNWWQEKKFLKASHEQYGNPKRDALMDDFHIDTDAVLDDKQHTEKAFHANEPVSKTFASDAEKNISTEKEHLAETKADAALKEPVPEPVKSTAESTIHAGEIHEEVVDPGIVVDWSEDDDLKEEDQQTESSTLDLLADEAESSINEPEQKIQDIFVSLPDVLFQRIDLIALLTLPHFASGAHIKETLAKMPDHNKLVRVYAFNKEQHWVLLTNEQNSAEFSHFACALQLADRAGPVINDTLQRYLHAVQESGEILHARVEWQNEMDVLQYAKELDAFCIEVDKTVGFHIIQGGNGPFTGTKLRGLAEAGGLRLAEDGAFHFENEDGQKLFSVMNQDNYPFTSEMLRTSVVHRITFQLDVARVKNSIEAFNHMVLIARQMVNGLNANLVDDNQRPLSDGQLDKIRQQLRVIQSNMTTHGIIPGSACALRLFS